MIYTREYLLNKGYREFTDEDVEIGMSQRNKDIARKFMDGKRPSELSGEYNVSYNRICKVIMEFTKRVKRVEEGRKQ